MIWSPFGSLRSEFFQGRVVDIEAVNIVYSPAIFLQKCGQREKPQGLGPQVIGGEVVDPGVYQEEISPFPSQGASSIVKGVFTKPLLRNIPSGMEIRELPFIMMVNMQMGMRVCFILMPMTMDMYEIIDLEQLVIFQDFPRATILYYSFLLAEYVNYVR